MAGNKAACPFIAGLVLHTEILQTMTQTGLFIQGQRRVIRGLSIHQLLGQKAVRLDHSHKIRQGLFVFPRQAVKVINDPLRFA